MKTTAKYTRYLYTFFLIIFLISSSVLVQAQSSDYYKPYRVFDPNAIARVLTVGDVNGDGRDDVVMVAEKNVDRTEYSNKIMVFTQTADGRLANFVGYPLANYFYGSVDIGDLNGDGRNDVVVGTINGISVYYQNASGTLNAATNIDFHKVTRLRAADLNGDALADVVALDSAGSEVYVLYQSGGALAAPVSYTVVNQGAPDLKVGDLNDDGLNDIAVSSGFGNYATSLAVLYRQAGGFSAPTYIQDGFAVYDSIAIADINNDTRNDLITLDTSGGLQIYHQNGSGTLDIQNVYYANASSSGAAMQITDANRDGLEDILIANQTSMGIRVQQAGGLGVDGFPLPVCNWPPHPHFIDCGDLNGDGREDIALAYYFTGLLVVYGSDGNPDLAVQYPGRGVELNIGDIFPIRWKSTPGVSQVNIFYSIDGGQNWESIASNTANDGWYDWLVPNIPSADCKIRIVNASGGEPQGETEAFEILDDGSDRITVTYPNGGENYAAENNLIITWNSNGSIANVKIEYSTDNGGTWSTASDSTPNDGSYSWTVPNSVSSQCLIRISDAVDSLPTDTSDGTFSILAPGSETLNLTSPNGGEVLTAGDTHTITWDFTNSLSLVAIYYTVDNGTTWKTIDPLALNTGSYNWTVPNLPSTQCRVRITDALNANPNDQSSGVFTITTAASVPATITVTAPNGGETCYAGLYTSITWTSTGTVGNVCIQYSTSGGSSWTTIVKSAPNNGRYDWAVPNTLSTNCKVRVKDAADGDPSDSSNSGFTIAEYDGDIYITQPQNDDYAKAGGSYEIKWGSHGDVGNVKIELSTNNKSTWTTIVSSTANDGSYTWDVPNTPSNRCNIRISDASDGAPSIVSSGNFAIVTGSAAPEISLSTTRLNFAHIAKTPTATPGQTLLVDNSGIGTLRWNMEKTMDNPGDNGDWLRVSSTSGIQAGEIDIRVDPFGMAEGTYSATLTFTDANAANSPQTAKVYLYVHARGSDTPPRGSFDTPGDGSTVMSSIPVTGWVVDDIGVEKVTIWRSGTPAEGGGQIYIDDAVMVQGARPDIETAFPDVPLNNQAGWGYMMLTNGLPDGGNSTYTLYAYAKDFGGNEVLLGSKTIHCDNAHAVKPFGAIDTPVQGGEVYGTKSRCRGWALTPQPNKIPENGSTLRLLIDGQFIGNVNYNNYREDIARFFPGYGNSNGASGYIDFDTTLLDNGVHTIQWTAKDTGGNSDGIGSRFFTVANFGGSASRSSVNRRVNPPVRKGGLKTLTGLRHLNRVPVNHSSPVSALTGYDVEAPAKIINPGGSPARLEVPQDQRVVLGLSAPGTTTLQGGFLEVNGQLRPLPAGASLNLEKGNFYWQIGPVFYGDYTFAFIIRGQDGVLAKKMVTITVTSKF